MKIGVILCDRYQAASRERCIRAIKNKEGAFERYQDMEVELVDFHVCGGCPGLGAVAAAKKMVEAGAEIIHLSTGLLAGFPPCGTIGKIAAQINEQIEVGVIIGTHPVSEKVFLKHRQLGTWSGKEWQMMVKSIITDEDTRISYN